MRIGYLRDSYLEGRGKFASVLLIVFSVFLAVLILIKVAALFVASARAEDLVKRTIARGETEVSHLEECIAESKALADELKSRNLFAPPPAKRHPVSEVSGILGGEVLINGRWYKVGDKIGDARVVSIEPTRVRIEWEGTEKIFAPMSESGFEGPGGPRHSKPDTERAARRRKTRTAEASMVVVGPDGRSNGRRGGSKNRSEKERAALKLKAKQKLRSPIEKGNLKKLLKPAAQNKQAGQKKPAAAKTKKNADSKPKKATTQSKTKKSA